MSFNKIKFQHVHLTLMVILFVSLLGALLISSDALRTSARFDFLYLPLLVMTSTGLVVLVGVIVLNLYQLLRQVRLRRAGAQLSVRLMVAFVLLSSVPVLIMYYFSLEFLLDRVDSWSNVEIDQALQDALELSRLAIDDQMRHALLQTQHISATLTPENMELATMQMGELRASSGASEVYLIAANGHIIAFNSGDISQLLPKHPPETMSLKFKPSLDQQEGDSSARNGDNSLESITEMRGLSSYGAPTEPLLSLENISGRGMMIRAVVPCALPTTNETRNLREPCMIHALFPVKERVEVLARQVEQIVEDYQELNFLRQPLKINFTLVLSLVLLATIFGAVWVAFFSARRLVAPIRDLAEATRAVAAGNYHTQLQVNSSDELGFLVRSFNGMTQKIQLAQEDVQRSRHLADTQRAYLETVLERLSSGVLSLDHKHCLRTANSAAEQILGLTLSELRGRPFCQVCEASPALQPLCEALENHHRENNSETAWQAQITVSNDNGRKILMCRGKSFTDTDERLELPNYSGHVLVFDDITALIQAQRTAAWSEVAQRIAHEIKNPLTPIQLSAERLRHKYLPSFPDKEAEVLDRMTHTIIQQVEALKDMVNNFNDYARPPRLKLEPVILNSLIMEVLDLYRYQEQRIRPLLAENMPILQADMGRLRQILHNLLKNALEATTDGVVTICTRYDDRGFIELEVRDEGAGFDPNLLDQIFEPYITNKSKGSGLGLAIVKKIVEEHGGTAHAHNHNGACVTLRFPLLMTNPDLLETSPNEFKYR